MSEMIGFIGLGNMGHAMASSLLKAGFALTVYNRTASKAEALIAKGAQLAHQPGEAVTKGGIVVSMVANDQALEGIVLSPGFLERLGPNGIPPPIRPVSPATSRKLAELPAEHGSGYVAAPVFGRPEAAAASYCGS